MLDSVTQSWFRHFKEKMSQYVYFLCGIFKCKRLSVPGIIMMHCNCLCAFTKVKSDEVKCSLNVFNSLLPRGLFKLRTVWYKTKLRLRGLREMMYRFPASGSVFTNQSQKHALSFFSPKCCTFECDTPSDRLNRTVEPIRGCVTFKCC